MNNKAIILFKTVFLQMFALWWCVTFVLLFSQIWVMSQKYIFLLISFPFGVFLYFVFRRGFIFREKLRYKLFFGLFMLLSALPLLLQFIGLKTPDVMNVISAMIGFSFWHSLYSGD